MQNMFIINLVYWNNTYDNSQCECFVVLLCFIAKQRSHVVQLVGAVATLVLLGVPWMFSAFGAIDATVNDELALLEGIFQVNTTVNF